MNIELPQNEPHVEQPDELAKDPSWTGQTKLEKNIEDKEINYQIQLEKLEEVLKGYREYLSKGDGSEAYLAELEKYSDQMAKIHETIYGDRD